MPRGYRPGPCCGRLRQSGSSFRVAAGFAIAASGGVAVGSAIGWSRFIEKTFEPTLQMLRPVLAPVIGQMIASFSDQSVHFSRFAVIEIVLTPAALGQVAPVGMVAAARLLDNAKFDTIAWNGASGAWLGFEQDERLCAGSPRPWSGS